MQLTVRDAARILQVTDRVIHRWIRGDGLPAERIDGRYRLNGSQLLEWALVRRLRVSEELFQENGAASAPLPGLADAVAAGGVFHGVRGADRASVLRSVVASLPLPEGSDRDLLFQVLLARETLGSTAVGDGIALPHVRNPIVVRIPSPAISLSYLETPVDFAAPDGRPVHTLFTLVSPTVRVHLHLLSRLTTALRDPAFKETILRRAGREAILAAARRVEAGVGSGAPAAAGGGARA